jgi:predicted nucleotide-binding protein
MSSLLESISPKSVIISKYSPKAFIVMQYTEEYNELFNEVIKPVCEEYGLEAIRADDLYTQNQVIQDIIFSIRESAIIIADITPDNPNVYYDVGFSHGINKPTVLLCDTTGEKLPFDLSGFRTIFYKNKIAGKSKIEETPRKHLKAIGF